jgi:hypothetical protein
MHNNKNKILEKQFDIKDQIYPQEYIYDGPFQKDHEKKNKLVNFIFILLYLQIICHSLLLRIFN